MTKQHLDVEKLFEDSFKDFTPKTSEIFDAKMAKRLGLASILGFTISSSLAKIGGAIKALSVETLSLLKTVGIVKSIAIITLISTAVTTLILINNAEKTNAQNTQLAVLHESKNVTNDHLYIFEKKTAFINITEIEAEYKVANYDLINNKATHNELKPVQLIFNSNPKLDKLSTKNTTALTEAGNSNTSVSQQLATNSINENTNAKAVNDTEVSSNTTGKQSSISDNSTTNDLQNKHHSNVLSTKYRTEDERLESNPYLKTIPFYPLKIERNSNISTPRNKLRLTADIIEEPSDNSLLSDMNLFGEVHFMPFSYYNLSSIKPLTNDTIANQFIEESPQLSFQLGFDIRMQKKHKPWFVNLGVNYQKISEQIDYYFVEKTIGYWDYDSTVYYLINPPHLDTIYQVDSSFTTQYAGKENDIMHTNSYHYLNVPIQFGYEFFRKKEFSLQVSTGIEMAARINSSGYVYNYKGQISNYADIETSLSVDWYYLASFGLNYQMKKTTLFILPSIKYQLNTGKTNPYPKEHKYFIYGLKFGLRFKLF